jgi:hypothetical protein
MQAVGELSRNVFFQAGMHEIVSLTWGEADFKIKFRVSRCRIRLHPRQETEEYAPELSFPRRPPHPGMLANPFSAKLRGEFQEKGQYACLKTPQVCANLGLRT